VRCNRVSISKISSIVEVRSSEFDFQKIASMLTKLKSLSPPHVPGALNISIGTKNLLSVSTAPLSASRSF
jgi:hypothetical protein